MGRETVKGRETEKGKGDREYRRETCGREERQ